VSQRAQLVRNATFITSAKEVVCSSASVSDHVRDVISRCAQSLHALKILRCHGMNSDVLKTVYKSVVLAKLYSTLPPPGGVLQTRMTKTGSKRLYDVK